MKYNLKTLRFFATWFLIVGAYIIFVTFMFSIYSTTITYKKNIKLEEKIGSSLYYLDVAIKDYPNNPALIKQKNTNKEVYEKLKEKNLKLEKLKITIIDIPFYISFLIAGLLYILSSVLLFKGKRFSISIIRLALFFSFMNLLAMPFLKKLKGVDTGFPHYCIIMIISIMCYMYAYFYFSSNQIVDLLKE